MIWTICEPMILPSLEMNTFFVPGGIAPPAALGRVPGMMVGVLGAIGLAPPTAEGAVVWTREIDPSGWVTFLTIMGWEVVVTGPRGVPAKTDLPEGESTVDPSTLTRMVSPPTLLGSSAPGSYLWGSFAGIPVLDRVMEAFLSRSSLSL